MALALQAPAAGAPRPRTISPLRIEAELACLMCGRVVGDIVDGRVIQHPGCNGRLRLERGIVRCCHCGGPVYRDPMIGLAAQ